MLQLIIYFICMLVHEFILLFYFLLSRLLFPVFTLVPQQLTSAPCIATETWLSIEMSRGMSLQQQMPVIGSSSWKWNCKLLLEPLNSLAWPVLEDESPTKNLLPNPDGVTSDAKKAYLRWIATLVVDSFIIDHHRNEKMWQSVGIIQHKAAARQQEPPVAIEHPPPSLFVLDCC